MLEHVIFFLNTTSNDKINFVPLHIIKGVLRKVDSCSPALLLLHPTVLTGQGFFLFLLPSGLPLVRIGLPLGRLLHTFHCIDFS